MPDSKNKHDAAIEVAALALKQKQIRDMYALAEAEKKKHQFSVKDFDSAHRSQTFIAEVQFNEHSSTLSDGGHTTDEDGSDEESSDEDQVPNTYTVKLSPQESTSAGSSPATPTDAQSCIFTVMQPTTASNGRIVVKSDSTGDIDPETALRLQLMVVFRHLAATATKDNPLSEIYFHQFTGLPEGVKYIDASTQEEGIVGSVNSKLQFTFTTSGHEKKIDADKFISDTLLAFMNEDALGDRIQSVDSLNVFMPGEKSPIAKTSTAADTEEKGLPAVRDPKSRHATGSQTWVKWLGGMAVISTIPGLANYFSQQDSNDETPFFQGLSKLIKEIDGEVDSAKIYKKTEDFLQGLKVKSLGKDEFDLLKLLSKNASSDSCSAESMNPLVNSSPTTPQPAMADAVSHFLTKAKEELAQQLESYTEVTSANVQEVHQRIQDVKDLDIGIDTSGLEQQLEDFKAAFVNYTEVTSANAKAVDQRIKDAKDLDIGIDTSCLERQLDAFKAGFFVDYTEVTSANAQAVGQRIKDANGLNIGLDTSGLEQQLEDFETQKQQLIERLAKVPTTQEEATALEADIESAKAMGLGGDGDSVVATAKQQLEDFGTRKQQLIEQLAGYTEVTQENAETVRELIANAISIGVEVPDTLTKSLGYFQTQKLNLEQQSQTLTSAVEAFNSKPSVKSFEQIITQSELLMGQPHGSEYSSPVVKNITADAMRTFISESPDHIRGFDGLGLNSDCQRLVNEHLGKVAQFLKNDLEFLGSFSSDEMKVSDLEKFNLIESRYKVYPKSYAKGINQDKLTGLLQEARDSLSSIQEEYKQACGQDYTHKDQLQGLEGQIAFFNSRGIETQVLQQKHADLKGKISAIQTSLANTFPRDLGGEFRVPSSPCSLSDRKALLDNATAVGIDVTEAIKANKSIEQHMKKLEGTLSNPSADLNLQPIRYQLATLEKLIGEEDVAALKTRFDSVSQAGIEGLDNDFSVVPHVGAHNDGNDSLLISGPVQDYSSSVANGDNISGPVQDYSSFVANGDNIQVQFCLPESKYPAITDVGEQQNNDLCAQNGLEALSSRYEIPNVYPLPGGCYPGVLDGSSGGQDAVMCLGEPISSNRNEFGVVAPYPKFTVSNAVSMWRLGRSSSGFNAHIQNLQLILVTAEKFTPNKLLDVIGVSRENMNALICQWALISMCEQAICSVIPEEHSALIQCSTSFFRVITFVYARMNSQNTIVDLSKINRNSSSKPGTNFRFWPPSIFETLDAVSQRIGRFFEGVSSKTSGDNLGNNM